MSTETTQSSALDTLGTETRTFPPPADFVRQANAHDGGIYDQAEKDFEGFWAEHARSLSWRRPFTKVLEWDAPYAKWFADGQLNVAENCLDRHVRAGKGAKVAYHWEGEPGDTRTLTYQELLALPRKTVMCDMHCVTRWSRLDNAFAGVPVQLLLERARVKPAARYCLVAAEQGFTTNLPLADLDRPENLIALTWNREPLAPEHGWPARLLVPHLYLWKSAKWVRGFTLLDADVPGFWEQNGYHMRGDPWKEERYGGRAITQHEINRLRNLSKKDV